MVIIKKKTIKSSFGEDLEKRLLHSFTIGENVNWYSYYVKRYSHFSKN